MSRANGLNWCPSSLLPPIPRRPIPPGSFPCQYTKGPVDCCGFLSAMLRSKGGHGMAGTHRMAQYCHTQVSTQLFNVDFGLFECVSALKPVRPHESPPA